MAIVYRTSGPWGPGIAEDLSAEQVAVRAAVAVAGEAVEAVQALRPGLQMR